MRVIVLLTLSAFFGACSYPVGKYVLREISPLTLSLLRYVISSAVIFFIWYAKGPERLARKDILPIGVLGFLGDTVFIFALYIGLLYTTAAHGSLMISTHPILTAILSTLIFRETLKPLRGVGMALAVAGVAVVLFYGKGSGGEQAVNIVRGDLISLGGALSIAVFTVFSKPYSHRYKPLTLSSFAVFFGTAGMLPFSIPGGFASELSNLSSLGWLLMVYSGVTTALLIWFFFLGLQKTSPTRVATFFLLVPIFAALLGYAFLGEKLTGMFLIGMALVLGGLYLVNSRWASVSRN